MKETTLNQLAEVQTGYPFRKKVEHDPRGDVAVVQARDVREVQGERMLDADGLCRIRLPAGSRPEGKFLQPGDVLYMIRSETPYAVGIFDLPLRAVAQNSFNVIRLKPGAGLLPAYLVMVLNQPLMQARVGALMKQGTVPYVQIEDLRNLTVPVPPAERQRDLVNLEKKLARQRVLHRQLETLRQQELNALILENIP